MNKESKEEIKKDRRGGRRRKKEENRTSTRHLSQMSLDITRQKKKL